MQTDDKMFLLIDQSTVQILAWFLLVVQIQFILHCVLTKQKVIEWQDYELKTTKSAATVKLYIPKFVYFCIYVTIEHLHQKKYVKYLV